MRHEVVVYDAADHGFFCDQRATYHAAVGEGRVGAGEAAVLGRTSLAAHAQREEETP